MNKKPTLLIDQAIPLLPNLCEKEATVVLFDSTTSLPKLTNADGFFVRTVTRINESLLKGSSVKFVGSPTAGLNHLDLNYLKKNNIQFAHAPGCNAKAVTEYVITCIALLQSERKLASHSFSVGLLGVGQVGQTLKPLLKAIGAEIIEVDPPRAEKEKSFTSAKLIELQKADLISLHVPLSHEGPHATQHLITHDFLTQLKPGTVLINTARGEIIPTQALLESPNLTLCLDVYEEEPTPNQKLLKHTFLSTPHIAGYTKQAKERASYKVYEAASRFFGWETTPPPALGVKQTLTLEGARIWQEVILAIYDPRQDSIPLTNNPSQFSTLRNTYSFREEFERFTVIAPHLPATDKAILERLGVKLAA